MDESLVVQEECEICTVKRLSWSSLSAVSVTYERKRRPARHLSAARMRRPWDDGWLLSCVPALHAPLSSSSSRAACFLSREIGSVSTSPRRPLAGSPSIVQPTVVCVRQAPSSSRHPADHLTPCLLFSLYTTKGLIISLPLPRLPACTTGSFALLLFGASTTGLIHRSPWFSLWDCVMGLLLESILWVLLHIGTCSCTCAVFSTASLLKGRSQRPWTWPPTPATALQQHHRLPTTTSR